MSGSLHAEPDSPDKVLESGIQAFEQEDFETAIEHLSVAMKRAPENPLPSAYLAFICARQGLVTEACDFIAQTARIAPNRTDLIAALGESFLEFSQASKAVVYLQEAVRRQPDLFAEYPALARSLQLTGHGEEAVSLLQAAANLPSNTRMEIQNVLLQILAECGDLSEFTKYVQRFSRGLGDDLLAARCLARFDESGEEFLASLSRVQSHLQDVDSSAPARNGSGLTRIAFMVGKFTTEHQIAQLYALLRHLPPERFFTLLIFSRAKPVWNDPMQVCASLADTTLQMPEDTDAEAVEKIRALAPDILIDTEVYAPSARLAVFLAAPARHKFLWAEAPMPPIAPDIRSLAGARLGAEDMLPTLLLPEMGEVFDLPERPLSSETAWTWGDAPVLGCLIPAAGIARSGWQFMAQALRACPGAKLVINLDTLGEPARAFIRSRFAAEGLETERLIFISVHTTEDFCLAWQSIDLGLLPPVHHGGLALPTCLWMGKPCLAPASALPWSQRPAALLKALGKEEWIAHDAAHYAELARDIASRQARIPPDPTLRERMKALGLDDAKRFAHGFAQAMPHTA